MSDLIKRVATIQRAEGLSDRDFATELGISNGLWSGIKSGKREAGPKVLAAIAARYPGLRREVEAYWLSQLDLPTGSNTATAVA